MMTGKSPGTVNSFCLGSLNRTTTETMSEIDQKSHEMCHLTIQSGAIFAFHTPFQFSLKQKRQNLETSLFAIVAVTGIYEFSASHKFPIVPAT